MYIFYVHLCCTIVTGAHVNPYTRANLYLLCIRIHLISKQIMYTRDDLLFMYNTYDTYG